MPTRNKAQQDQVDLAWSLAVWCVFQLSCEKLFWNGHLHQSKTTVGNIWCIGIEEHDQEGRVITAEFEKFYLVTVYTQMQNATYLV